MKLAASKLGSARAISSSARAIAVPGSAKPFHRSAAVAVASIVGRAPFAPGSRTTLSWSAEAVFGRRGGSRLEIGSSGGCSLPVFCPRTDRSRQTTKTASTIKMRVVMSKESCIVDPLWAFPARKPRGSRALCRMGQKECPAHMGPIGRNIHLSWGQAKLATESCSGGWNMVARRSTARCRYTLLPGALHRARRSLSSEHEDMADTTATNGAQENAIRRSMPSRNIARISRSRIPTPRARCSSRAKARRSTCRSTSTPSSWPKPISKSS